MIQPPPLFRAVSNSCSSRIIVLIAEYLIVDTVAPKCCGCRNLALGPQYRYFRFRNAPVLLKVNAVFQVIQGTAFLVSLSRMSAEFRAYVLCPRRVAVAGLIITASSFILTTSFISFRRELSDISCLIDP